MHSSSLLVLLAASLLPSIGSACPGHGDWVPNPYEKEQIAAAEHRKRHAGGHPRRKYEITNVHVFDGFRYHHDLSSVIIDGDRIGTDNRGAIKIDGKGGTIMPGLFDNHNHPTTLDHLEILTTWGVTTTMCMSCFTSDLCECLRNQPGLADFYSGGWSATVVGSSHYINNGNTTAAAIFNTTMCPDWVKGRIDTGSDFLKLVSEDYGLIMSLEEHVAINEAAHGHRVKTATHASRMSGYEIAVKSGTDYIQHVSSDFLLNSTLIAAVLKNGQYVTPTLNAFQYVASPALASVLNITSANAKALYDAGVPILAGTDSTNHTGNPFPIPFGTSIHRELEMLSQSGIPNIDVLKAATSRAADVYNMHDRGVIAPGKRADLLLIRGNPLANISKTQEIEKVWVMGKEYKGSE